MRNEIINAFGEITAGQSLKDRTFYAVEARLRPKAHRSPVLRWAALAACLFVAVFASVSGVTIYHAEAATISIDLNPSLELGLNQLGRVVSTRAFNEEGEKLLETADVKNKKYDEALETLLSGGAVKPYLETKDALLSLTLQADQPDMQLFQSIQSCIDQVLAQQSQSVQTEYNLCDEPSIRDAAHEHGMSVGKYCAVLDLMHVDPGATVEEFQDQSMQEIHEHMDQCQHQTRQGQAQAAGGSSTPAPDTATSGQGYGHHGQQRRHHSERH